MMTFCRRCCHDLGILNCHAYAESASHVDTSRLSLTRKGGHWIGLDGLHFSQAEILPGQAATYPPPLRYQFPPSAPSSPPQPPRRS